MVDVGLVTYSGKGEQTPDDNLLEAALQRRDLSVSHPSWDDLAVEWADFRLLVVRSTWNYHFHREAFLGWSSRVSQITSLWNPARVIDWNTHKGYLRDLSDRGVAIVPTVWLERGAHASLGEIMRAQGWDRVVVKPAVSASAYHTTRVDHASLAEGQAHLDAGLARGDMMVQPYLEWVATGHERSLIFLGGEFSHAVRRAPILDMAHESEFQPSAVGVEDGEMQLARRALAAVPWPLLYARVDIAREGAGTPALMELELVEPYLFLECAQGSAERFAEAVVSHL